MKYALISNGAVVSTRSFRNNFDPATVAHKFDYRPINKLPNPPFDPATHKLEGFTYTVNPDSVDVQRTVVALNQDDLARETARDTERTERDVLRAVYTALRQGKGTNANRLTRVERVLAYFMRDEFGV